MIWVRLLTPPVAFLLLAFYFGSQGNTFATAASGAIAAMFLIYLLFPRSGLARAAFKDIGAQYRAGETPRAFHFRCARYWLAAAAACVVVLFAGACAMDAAPFLRNSAVAGAIVFFIAPILGVSSLVRAIAESIKALRR